MQFFAVFVDDHDHGSMRLVATYLDEYAACGFAQVLSPSGDGIKIVEYQALNCCDVETWPEPEAAQSEGVER